MALNYEVVIKGGDKAFNVFQNLNKINETSKKINNVYQKMGQSSLTQVNKKMKDIKATTIGAQKEMSFFKNIIAGNYLGALKTIKSETGNSLKGVFDIFSKGFLRNKAQGGSFFAGISRGMSGVIKAFRAGALSIKGILAGLGASLGPFLAVGAAIVAVVLTIKRMWHINFLGMQSTFAKVVGEIKTGIGKFSAGFTKFLRSIEPVAKIVLMPLITSLKSIWTILKGVAVFFSAAFSPMVEVFKEVGDAFKELNISGKSSAGIFEGIIKVFKILGQIIGFIVKATLMPFKMAFLAIADIMKFVKGLFEQLAETKFFKVISKIFEGSKQVLDTISKIFGGKASNESETVKATVSSQRNITQDNRNQNITFNTGRATTPEQSSMFADILAKQLA